jgi:hypothetical protein
MPLMKLLIPCLALALLGTGCASAVHTRTAPNGVTDKTSIHTFLSTTAIKGFSETTWDGTGTNRYSRAVRVSDAGTQTEIEKLGPLIDSAVSAAVQAAIKGAKP